MDPAARLHGQICPPDPHPLELRAGLGLGEPDRSITGSVKVAREGTRRRRGWAVSQDVPHGRIGLRQRHGGVGADSGDVTHRPEPSGTLHPLDPLRRQERGRVVDSERCDTERGEIGSPTRRLVQLTGAAQVAAGTMLALGRLRRLSALVLVASVLPTTYVGRREWEEDPRVSVPDLVHNTFRTVGLVGALLVTVFDAGQPPTAPGHERKRTRQHGHVPVEDAG